MAAYQRRAEDKPADAAADAVPLNALAEAGNEELDTAVARARENVKKLREAEKWPLREQRCLTKFTLDRDTGTTPSPRISELLLPPQHHPHSQNSVPDGGRHGICDEVAEVVMRLLREFELRFVQRLEEKFYEIENKQRNLEATVVELTRVTGSLASPLPIHEGATLDGGVLQGAHSQAVPSRQAERSHMHSPSSSSSSIPLESREEFEHMHKLEREMRHVAEIMQQGSREVAPVQGQRTGDPELLALPSGHAANHMQTGIMTKLSAFEKSLSNRRARSRAPTKASI